MWNYRVAGPRHRESVLLAYGCFSDGGRMLSRSTGWRRQHSSHSFWEPETELKPTKVQIFLLTDHNPLVFLTSAAPQCPRLQRWALAIQRHDIDASHMKGSKLVNADVCYPDCKCKL
ncbi:hypothetical protein TNCV_1501341 [Trichonephila clavipes]|uniref:Uncharacterized protein n=1 Tax=Trichonephila clavipes TaxID=2585209 RepID=A0A8X6RW55_TRICX|nr:hypothetical protein TNCV_1501341 [Trichonephila clavipes]